MRRIIGRLIASAAAGVIATGTMSIAMGLFKLGGFLGEPPPVKLTRRILGPLGVNRSRPRTLALATIASHLGYGTAVAMLHELVPGRSSAAKGTAFGLAVWGVSYGGWIPKLGLMPRPALDRPGRPTSMILAHLVYGATLGFVRSRLGWGESTLRAQGQFPHTT